MANKLMFGDSPKSVKLQNADKVIIDYLVNQKQLVEAEKLSRPPNGDQPSGFVVIRLDEGWQIGQILGKFKNDKEWVDYDGLFILQLFDENGRSERVLVKLETNANQGCSAWETFHHVFSQTWLNDFTQREDNPEHWTSKFESPLNIVREDPELDQLFDIVDQFQQNGVSQLTPLDQCIEACQKRYSSQQNLKYDPTLFLVVDLESGLLGGLGVNNDDVQPRGGWIAG